MKLNGNENINQFFTPGNAIPQNAEYSEIKTIYETTHDFLTGGNFNYSGVYTPQSIHPGGWYRLKLEVTAPNGLKETNRYNYFYYFQSGAQQNIDLLTNKTLPPGSYTLKTELHSFLGQSLSQSTYNFAVKSGTLSIVLSGENDSQNNYLKPGEPRTINIALQNNSAEDISNVPYTLKKKSPSGAEEILKNQTLNLAAGQTYNDSFTFNETETGTWHIIATVDTVGNGNSFEKLFEVTSPSITTAINAPTYAANDPFPVTIHLKNDGKMETRINAQVTGAESQVKLAETISLQPGEEKVLTFNDTISNDTTYSITAVALSYFCVALSFNKKF